MFHFRFWFLHIESKNFERKFASVVFQLINSCKQKSLFVVIRFHQYEDQLKQVYAISRIFLNYYYLLDVCLGNSFGRCNQLPEWFRLIFIRCHRRNYKACWHYKFHYLITLDWRKPLIDRRLSVHEFNMLKTSRSSTFHWGFVFILFCLSTKKVGTLNRGADTHRKSLWILRKITLKFIENKYLSLA